MKTVDEIIQAVAELPDRNSPEGQPEMMLVTGDELREIVEAALKEREAPPKAQPMSDAIFLERLLREGSQELVGLTTFVNNSIQGGGRVQLLASAVLIRDFIYRCHGIGECHADR